MQAVILLGGLGTRLYPLTYTTPKVLLPIGGRPFLALLLEWLRDSGVTEAVFAVSHLKQAIASAAAGMDTGPLTIEIVTETKPLGSGGALKNCADVLAGDFLLLNGDVLMNVALDELYTVHEAKKAAVTVTVTEVEDPSPYGIISAGRDGRVEQWQEKPTREEARSKLANVGAWAISKRILDWIPPDQFVSLEKETFPQLLAERVPFYAYEFSGYWKDIGTAEKYYAANVDFLERAVGDVGRACTELRPGVYALGRVTLGADVDIQGPVFLGDGVEIGAGCRIRGPASVGSESVLGPQSVVSESILWEGCRVGSAATLSRTIVAGGIIGDRCELTDCVIAQDCRVGAGKRLGPGTVLGPRSNLE